MRTRAPTESARINEEVGAARIRTPRFPPSAAPPPSPLAPDPDPDPDPRLPRSQVGAQRLAADVLGGGRWTIDTRYGNPSSFSPRTQGDTFRRSSPEKWVERGEVPLSPPASPESRKWRGGFATTFPPGAGDALAHATSPPSVPWLHHKQPFEDRYHDMVAVNTARDPSDRAGFRPVRQKEKEISTLPFQPQVPTDAYLPNPRDASPTSPAAGSPTRNRCFLKSIDSPYASPARGSPAGRRAGDARGEARDDALATASSASVRA